MAYYGSRHIMNRVRYDCAFKVTGEIPIFDLRLKPYDLAIFPTHNFTLNKFTARAADGLMFPALAV
jgi:hypothetical protein